MSDGGVALTEAEREVLKVALYGNRAQTLTLEGGPVCEAVESILTARLAAVEAGRDAEADRITVQWSRERRRAEAAEQQLADLRASIAALAGEWEREGESAVAPLGLRVEHWRDWPRVRALRALCDNPACIFDPPGDCMSPDGLGCPVCTPAFYVPGVDAVRAQAKAEALREFADYMEEHGGPALLPQSVYVALARDFADQHAPTTGEGQS